MLEQGDYFDALNLGLDHLNPYISVNIDESETAGNVVAVIEVLESLEFHRELEASMWERIHGSTGARLETRIFDEDGWLTIEANDAMGDILKQRYGAVDVDLNTSDDPHIDFTVVLEVPARYSAEWLGLTIYNHTELVKFHNEADPGTFGTQYLFGTILAEQMEALALASMGKRASQIDGKQ